ncbi:CREB-regulated transcription coactivator 1-like isoform X2 [Trichogramma pretiosum]|uniref:CREB-regulated transcription coactivator 1-like isoform X2 n=1 Tax=Trichogramma pretiosum TaxID=7493 RepID=UPI0006C9860E|nr:CREB-regulated transcription coactivator 1-like isoform X2 [Trichogramma pretiosum]
MANPRKFSEKIALLNQKQAEETARFEAIMREVSDVTSRTALSNLEEMQQNQGGYRNQQQQQQQPQQIQVGQVQAQQQNQQQPERGRSMGVGPMRKPVERRHDTSPYSGVPYLSPPLPENWRRTISDSALHQSANEACLQNTTGIQHRRGSDTYQRTHGGSTSDNRESHHTFIERPRSSCDMPRVPGINVYPSSQPPGQQIPIGNNTGSLPDLSNMHFAAPLHTPLDQEDHSSGSQYSNSPQTGSPTTLSPTSLAQAKQRLSLTQEHSSSSAQQGLTMDGNQSNTQLHTQSQAQSIPGSTSPGMQQQMAHSPGHYVYQQPCSPIQAGSPNPTQTQMIQQNMQQTTQQFNTLTYRTSQSINRPSPQSSPSLTFQGSPLSYSNNPSAPSSPTSHQGPPTLSLDPSEQNLYSQVHADFEHFSMMDSPSTTIAPYMNSPSHSGTYTTQSDILSVASELGSGDGGYFSASPLQQLAYNTRTPTTTQQLTPQTPNTPTITLTDCSLGSDDLVNADFTKDFVPTMASFGQDLFGPDDQLAQDLNSLHHEDLTALRSGLDPIDLEDLHRLTNPEMVMSDPTTEADFRLEQH